MTDPWVQGLTMGEALRRRAAELPDHQAVVFSQCDFRATFSAYDTLVDEAAKGLIGMGIEHGDHVAVWATNRPEWLALQLATARIGAVLVNVNPAYRSHELAYALEQSDARAIFLIDRFKSSDYFDILREACPELGDSAPGKLQSQAFPRLRWVVSLADDAAAGMTTWSSIIDRGKDVTDAELAAREEAVDPEDPVNLSTPPAPPASPRACCSATAICCSTPSTSARSRT